MPAFPAVQLRICLTASRGVVCLGGLEVVGDYRLCLFAQASFVFLPGSGKDKESVQCSWSIAERYVASVCSLPAAGLVNHVACTAVVSKVSC